MKTILTALCFFLLPTLASAGILFGPNVRINNYGVSDGFAKQYGYSDNYSPRFRTYRVYRNDVQRGYWVPGPAAPVADPAPIAEQWQYTVPPTLTDTNGQTFSQYRETLIADEPVTSVKHKERHNRHRSKIRHLEVSR